MYYSGGAYLAADRRMAAAGMLPPDERQEALKSRWRPSPGRSVTPDGAAAAAVVAWTGADSRFLY